MPPEKIAELMKKPLVATGVVSLVAAKDGKDWKREVRQAVAERAQILSWWREECAKNGLPEDTPCPFFAKSAPVPSAPTEDQLQHDTQKNLNPNNRAKAN